MSAVATWAGGSARRATLRQPKVLRVSPPFTEGYSTNGNQYVTALNIPFAPLTGAEDRALLLLVSYQAKAAGTRAFTLPSFDGDDFEEALAPTSAGDKASPGVAIYYLADPGEDPEYVDIYFNEDMVSASAVILDLGYAAQSDAVDDTAGGVDASAAAALALRTLTTTVPGDLIVGMAAWQGFAADPITAPASGAAAGLARLVGGRTGAVSAFNDHSFAVLSRTTGAPGDYVVGANGSASDGRGDGWVAIAGTERTTGPTTPPVDPGDPPATGRRFVPPVPLADVDILTVVDGSEVTMTGTAAKDCLVVCPDAVLGQKSRVIARGYRGIYLIGCSMSPQAFGTAIAPDGRTMKGQDVFFLLETHKDAVGAFVYVANVHFDNDPDAVDASNINYGDIFNCQGDPNGDTPTNQASWPDIYLDNILVEGGLYGWESSLVAHSDVFKANGGGVKSYWLNRCDVTWGYQALYSTPTSGAGFVTHPDGEVHLYDTVFRIIRTKGTGATWFKEHPKAIYFSRGDVNIRAGEYVPHHFHEGGSDGSGVWLVDHTSPTDNFHPRAGNWAPQYDAAAAEWRWSSTPPPGYTKPLVASGGRIRAGEPPTPVVTAADVGHSHRVTDRAGILALIAAMT